jgi:sugar phosphate isomerase/epimerase
MIARRKLLVSGALALGGGSVGPLALARARAPLGLADITVQKQLAKNYAGTLERVASFGYTHFGFRLASYAPGVSELAPVDKAKAARDAGLQVGVVRFSPIHADYDHEIAQAVAVGAPVVAMTAAAPFISRRLGVATRAEFDAWLPQLAALGRKCRAAGLRLAYHTHWWDFMPLERGESPLDIIARTISPSEVAFEVDLAWCWYGGVAPLDLLRRLGARVASLHLKDIDRTRGKSITDHAVVIGRGEMGYAALLPRIRRLVPAAVAYVEVDSPDDGLAAAAEGARFFREHS